MPGIARADLPGQSEHIRARLWHCCEGDVRARAAIGTGLAGIQLK